jgi:alpha-ketoglutaric semialdehyde dehydrogenase
VRLSSSNSLLATTETFAPIMAVQAVTGGLSEVLEILHGLEYGLSASILTNNLDDATTFVEDAPVGMASVNLPTTGVEYQAPFGGWGFSGGPFPEAGPNALAFYTKSKTVAIARTSS